MIKNKTRNVVLHTDPVLIRGIVSQAIGLMFRKPSRECVIFRLRPPRREIVTMWFVFGPIDVLGLDGQGRVVGARRDLRPWRSWDTKQAVSEIIELPVGTLQRTKTAIGDRIILSPVKPGSVLSWYHYVIFWIVQLAIACAILLALVTIF